jgi:hypothetical protein
VPSLEAWPGMRLPARSSELGIPVASRGGTTGTNSPMTAVR